MERVVAAYMRYVDAYERSLQHGVGVLGGLSTLAVWYGSVHGVDVSGAVVESHSSGRCCTVVSQTDGTAAVGDRERCESVRFTERGVVDGVVYDCDYVDDGVRFNRDVQFGSRRGAGGEVGGVTEGDTKLRGRHYFRNKAKKDRKRAKAGVKQSDVTASTEAGDGIGRVAKDSFCGVRHEKPVGLEGAVPRGFERVPFSAAKPEYDAALSDIHREARESLAVRRKCENEVASELARLKLASLRDESRCRQYADLKRQRIVQFHNESVAKSQASLDKCKSIDPGSSASQYEIRQQAKELLDLKYAHEQFVKNVGDEYGDVSRFMPDKRIGTETLAFYQMEGEMAGEVAVHHDVC